MMRIVEGDLGDPRVVDLLHIHVTSARAETAPGSAHALDLTALQSPDVSFWTIWDDETLLGVGALKRLSADHGEIKSMHTAQSMRGRGAWGPTTLTTRRSFRCPSRSGCCSGARTCRAPTSRWRARAA